MELFGKVNNKSIGIQMHNLDVFPLALPLVNQRIILADQPVFFYKGELCFVII